MWSHSKLGLPASAAAMLLAVGVIGCTTDVGPGVTYDRHDGGGPPDAIPGFADVAVAQPDAGIAECPDLPKSFDDLGAQAATKNTVGGSHNVFLSLDGDPRWQVAMYLRPGRGVFAGGVAPGKYELAGDDVDFQFCAACVNLFADVDGEAGGARQHMFPTSGALTITSVSEDGKVSGKLETVAWTAIKIGWDEESLVCSMDDACVNTYCVDNQCGRQIRLAGCDTELKSLSF